MSGFVATASTTTAGDTVITNDGWFPDVDLDHLRQAVRLDGTITHERLHEAALAAVSHVNRQLTTFKAGHVEAGVATLATVPADQLDGESRLLSLYRRALYCEAKADLIERYRDLDITDSGQRRAEDLDPAIGEQRRNAFWAIRGILGQTRSVVELI